MHTWMTWPRTALPHFAGQVETGISLIHRVALRAGEVDEMATVLQHLSAAGLLTGLVCQMSRG